MTKHLVGCWIAAMLVVPLAGPALAASDPYLVKLEIALPTTDVVNPSGLTLRVIVDQPVVFTVRVFHPDDPDVPVDVTDTASLLEIRDVSGARPSVRLGDLSRRTTGVYRTTYSFQRPGRWMVITQPDVADRNSLPPGSTDYVTVIAEDPLVGAATETDRGGLVAVISLVVLVGALFVATRKRRRNELERPRQPVAHDTWWSSP